MIGDGMFLNRDRNAYIYIYLYPNKNDKAPPPPILNTLYIFAHKPHYF